MEAFLKENIQNIPRAQLPIFGYAGLFAVFFVTFTSKYFATGVAGSKDNIYTANSKTKNFLMTLIVSIQALAYSMVIVAIYIIPNEYLLLTKFLSILIGLSLTGVGVKFSG